MKRVAVVSLVLAGLWCLTSVAAAASAAEPTGPLTHVERVDLAPLDVEGLLAEDTVRELDGLAPRFAVPHPTLITPETNGTWDTSEPGLHVWRLRITSPGALSLNLGFRGYFMPPGGELLIGSADGRERLRPFTAADNADHGELWTPVVLSDDIVLEARVPSAYVARLQLELSSINVGYRGFGELAKAGSCNIDVVCPEGDGWQDQIKSVGVISTGGSTFCTGFLVNNTAEDRKPYFMTARHCGVTSSNAASLVVYWNFQSPTCGQQGGGSLSQYSTGSLFRSSNSASDFTLVELTQAPQPAFDVVYAGWDRSNAVPTAAIAVHHPNTDEKSISFEDDPLQVTSYLGSTSPGDGTHLRVVDWDLGTTEPGSSGSPLFNQDGRVVGQLHGGYAACGNDSSDWYGWFYVSWTGGGSSSTRLSDWLDPLNTGQLVVDALPHNPRTGLRVSPSATLTAVGPVGGPFTPASITYTLENVGTTALDYAVSSNATWVELDENTAGTLAPGATTDVKVMIGSQATLLNTGTYDGAVQFTNVTTGEGTSTRPVQVVIGAPQRVYFFPLDSNPGWTTEGEWAWGQPTGGGGQYGNADPTGGYTGPYVYGYNLAGDYPNSMPERHLTSPPIDCTDLTNVTLRFWRWLNVESPTYDRATLRVSNNGTTWVTVWQNPSSITDNSWRAVEYDISAVADNQPAVYLRWTMGATDSSWRYSGWNIDDIELWALVPEPDCNGNSVPDVLDINLGTSQDCNGNGHPDECDIADGTSLDSNGDGIPDECAPPILRGDANCDGVIDTADIDAFVLALVNPAGYAAAYPACDIAHADCNADGGVDTADIDTFVALIIGG